MLVEDDNNLREIYQARLTSEGYETVTASDGEEALSIVGREKPDLIILDVMMPKISGFDTLDLLKNSPVTKDIKVIMMTALSQAEDRARAQKLGAQNYLVKSQVTLEDIVKAIKDALDGTSVYPNSDVPESSAPATAPTPSVFNSATPAVEPVANPTPTMPNESNVPGDNQAPSNDQLNTTPTEAELDMPVSQPVENTSNDVSINHMEEPVAVPEIEAPQLDTHEVTTPSEVPFDSHLSNTVEQNPEVTQPDPISTLTTDSSIVTSDNVPTNLSPTPIQVNDAPDTELNTEVPSTNLGELNDSTTNTMSDDSSSNPVQPIDFNTPA